MKMKCFGVITSWWETGTVGLGFGLLLIPHSFDWLAVFHLGLLQAILSIAL